LATSKKLSRADLIKERARLEAERDRIDAEIAAQAKAELQSLVDSFKEHLAANDFALSDALALLGKKSTGKRGAPKAKSRISGDKPKSGVTYKHPNTGEEWTAPAQLRRAKKWLQDLATTTGKKYEDFAVKTK
jgi:DNA-binding protein H-NS